MLESVWACRWRLELGRTRSARFSPTYSAVVQPCYINVSVSGCLGLFTCQRFPAHSVCLLLSHPLLVHLFQVKHTPTQPHVIKKTEKKKKSTWWHNWKRSDWSNCGAKYGSMIYSIIVRETVLRLSLEVQSVDLLPVLINSSIPDLSGTGSMERPLPRESPPPTKWLFKHSEWREAVGRMWRSIAEQFPCWRGAGHHTWHRFSGAM